MSAHRSTKPAIRCVVFDLGGVLVRICRTWQEACARAGVAYDERLVSQDLMERRRALRDQHECGKIACEDFYAGIAQSTGGLITADQFRRVHEAWVIDEYPGVRGVVSQLKRAGVTTGVLSNTNHAHWSDLRQGIVREVDHPHASHLLGVAKPDPAIYSAFEREAGVAPRDVLFFDDLPANIAGANAAGWAAVLIDHTGDTAAQMLGALRDRRILEHTA